MLARWHQLILALVFLTRLPLERLLPKQIIPLAWSSWAFPLAGALIGAVASSPLLLPGPPLLLGAISVALSIWFTGALHEDALGDFADAAGGKDKAERLRIMRDSALGSYGILALIMTCGIRVFAVSMLSPAYLIAAAMCGRCAIVLTMGVLLPARQDGLGNMAGAPGAKNLIGASVLTIVILVLLLDNWSIPLIAGLAATAFTIWKARKWIGGQTGDVLGTSSILTETTMLAVFALYM